MEEQLLTSPLSEISDKEINRRKTYNKNKWFFSAGGIGRDMSYQLVGTFLLTYIQFGIQLTVAQFTIISLAIGVGGRIWDAINDPVMGSIIESTHMKFGKFKPWILIGAISCGAVILAMFNVQGLSGASFVVFIIIMYLLWESTFTMNDIGYWAMLPSLSSVKKERNEVTMMTVLFAGVGAIIAQGLIPTIATGNVRGAYRWISIVVVAAFVGCQIMTSLLCKETPHAEDFKQEKIGLKKMWKAIKNNDQILWMTLSQLFYNVGSSLLIALALNLLYTEVGYSGANYFYIVVAYGVTSVVVNVLYPKLANWLGRKKLQLFSIIVACVGYIIIACMGWGGNFSMPLLAVVCVFISSGQSLFYMACIVNMTNCVEYNEYKQGERNEAVISTLRPFMAKFGAACQYGITTLVLVASGVFIMSQSVATLETQKSMFEKLSDYTPQTEYILTIQQFATIDSEEALVEAVEANALMSKEYKLEANTKYIEALSDALILRNKLDSEGEKVLTTVMGRMDDLNAVQLAEASALAAANEGFTYKYELIVGDYTIPAEDKLAEEKIEIHLLSGFEAGKSVKSAADMHFKDAAGADLGARIWLRAAVSIVPIVLLICSLLIQRKKFIIDEDYYDMMLAEIEKREAVEMAKIAGQKANTDNQ